MVNIVNARFPFRSQSGNDKRRTAAQIVRVHVCTIEALLSVNDRRTVAYQDIGPHLLQLRHVFEPRLENIFGNRRSPAADRGERKHLRLQIGGKTGVRTRIDMEGVRPPAAFQVYYIIF